MSVLAFHPHPAESRPTQHEQKAAVSVDNAKRLGLLSLHPEHRRHDMHAASRSQERKPLPGPADTYTSGDPRAIGQKMAADRGWVRGEWTCLRILWDRESGWSVHASNPSGAYGIPQALPGEKMASAGGDWQNNPVTQIAWGLDYIANRYKTPCAALGHSNETGYY